ncbi:MAG: CinA family protein [Rickettsiaceae bacterium]
MLDKVCLTIVKQIQNNIRGREIATAESCTGGMLATYLTAIAGSSEYFSTGIISYSNNAKIKLLNVNKKTLLQYGAVSEQVAGEMALGICQIANSDIAISITGLAGPSNDTTETPVGTICFALADKNKLVSCTHYLKGDRNDIRSNACRIGLELILDIL